MDTALIIALSIVGVVLLLVFGLYIMARPVQPIPQDNKGPYVTFRGEGEPKNDLADIVSDFSVGVPDRY